MSNASSKAPLHQARKGRSFYHPVALVLLTIFIFLASQFVSILLFGLYPFLYNRTGQDLFQLFEQSIAVQFVHVFLVEIFIVLLIFGMLKLGKIGAAAIGIVKPRLRDIGHTIIGFGYYFPIVWILSYVLSILVPGFDTDQVQAVGFEGAVGGELVLVFIALAVFPPLVEEILFRGFLYSGLRNRLGQIPSSLVVAVLFAAAHLGGGVGSNLLWVAAIDTFILSLILTHLREKTGSLWPAIGLHSLKNTIAFLSLFVFA